MKHIWIVGCIFFSVLNGLLAQGSVLEVAVKDLHVRDLLVVGGAVEEDCAVGPGGLEARLPRLHLLGLIDDREIAHQPAAAAISSIMPSPMKNPGPTARFTQGKHEHSSPRNAS